MEFFDSHSHYNDEKYDVDRKQIIEENYKKGITNLLCAGYSLDSSKFAIQLSTEYEHVYASCGISPNDIDEYVDEKIEEIRKIAKSEKVVAIGEIGLDYYWNKDNKEKQKEVFIKQLDLAQKYSKPIVVHSRESIQDVYDILKNYKLKGSIHCFSSSLEMAKEFIKLGYKIGIGGVVTFKNSIKLQEIVKELDIKDILIETDSPYLTPEPFRGKRNEPSNVLYVAKKISELKNINLEDVIIITRNNATREFDLKQLK